MTPSWNQKFISNLDNTYPLIKRVEVHPLNWGGGLSKTTCFVVLLSAQPLNEGGEPPPPYLRGYGLSRSFEQDVIPQEYLYVSHFHEGGVSRLTEGVWVRYFRNPCDRDPPTRNFKNLKCFKNALKILNVYFQGTSVYFWGTSVYFRGMSVYFWGQSGFSGFFWNFFFCCWGVFGLRGSGGPAGVLENI